MSNNISDMYKKETTNTTNTLYEPEPIPEPNTNTYYKYSSQSTTNRTEPRVAPFPIEGIQQPTQVDGTPKHLNQLLASFDDVKYIAYVLLEIKGLNWKNHFPLK